MVTEACVMSEHFMLLQQALGEVRDPCFCLWCISHAAWLRPRRERVTEAERLAFAHLRLAGIAIHRHYIIVWTGKAMQPARCPSNKLSLPSRWRAHSR